MNRTYKVIWSKARHCYVVVSELTKSQHKSSSKSELISTNIHQKRYFGKAAVAAIVAGLLTFGGVAYSPVLAADNTAGSGDGVAIGTNSNAPKKENVAIGKGATIKYSNGESKSTGDVAVGSGAVIDNYASQGGSIAIGNNVSIENMAGQQEKAFGFGQTTYTPKYDPDYWWGLVPVAQIPDDPTRVPGSIAIGQNSYARTGGLTIGIHNYQGKLGDVTINTSNEKDVNVKSKNVFETTLGTNSFNAGAFSTVMGAYSIASGNYEGGNDTSAATKNFGATITGSLNSIESATFSSPYSGIANSIVGTANRASNSNGSLIFGAGNEIQNSITDISSAPSSGGDSAQALQNNLMKAVQDSESGGATLAIGGGNKANYTQKTSIIGVNNTVVGEKSSLTFAGDDGKSDNSKVISRKLNEQLNIVGGATETVDAANIGVVRKDDDTLNIRLAKDITGLNSLQATTVTSGNVTVDGQHNVITGLSNTTWDKTKDYSQSTKAATEAQLHEAMTQATADANDTHITAGDYAVGTITDKDGQSVQGVSIDVVDKTGKVGTVRITDVAKASDVGNVTDLNADIKNAEGKTTVVDAVNHVDNKVGNLDYSSTKYVKKGEDVTTSIGKLDEAIKYASEAAGKHTIVSTEDANLSVENIAKEGEAANYQISLNKDLNVDSVTAANKITTKDLEVTGSAAIGKVTINKDDKGTIGGLTNKTWDAKNITSGQAATEDQLQAATKNAVNYDGDDSKTVTLREDTTIQNVANTTIEEGSKNAVNAGTVYKETRVEKDGIFIRQANTAGQNITALDHQVAANTESIYHINNRVSDLDNRVNKVGAGAAALAALHPLDFDPNDKWDFAVGYGNYRNANSVALGAFYRPNEDTMFSLGTNFGNGENMFNAGLSFKIGQGGSGITTSKTAMAKKIESLENTVDQQDKKIAELEALVKEQGEMIRQYVGKK